MIGIVNAHNLFVPSYRENRSLRNRIAKGCPLCFRLRCLVLPETAEEIQNPELLPLCISITEWHTLLKKLTKCAYCQRGPWSFEFPPTIDHIIPRSEGGGNTPRNIQPLCKGCNSRKQNKWAESALPRTEDDLELSIGFYLHSNIMVRNTEQVVKNIADIIKTDSLDRIEKIGQYLVTAYKMPLDQAFSHARKIFLLSFSVSRNDSV